MQLQLLLQENTIDNYRVNRKQVYHPFLSIKRQFIFMSQIWEQEQKKQQGEVKTKIYFRLFI